MSARHISELLSRKNSLLRALHQLWHLPDNFHWLSPLPNAHRRWLIVILIAVTVLLLLPSPKPTIAEPVNKTAPIQAALVIDGYQPFENTGISPVQFIGNRIKTENDDGGTWKTLQVQPGQSLSQTFRDNSLPIEDALALTKVEGSDKPLSNLKAGQHIKVKLDAANKIAAVDVEMADRKQAFFIRQPDGEFYRYQ